MKRAANTEPGESYFVLHGLLVVVLALSVLGVVRLSMRGAFSETTHVSALMKDIGGGLVPGSDVKMRGLVVGRVAHVDGRPGAVVLDLELDDDTLGQLPNDVQARVLPASVFGTSYLELTRPPTTSLPQPLEAGDSIHEDLTAPTLELQRALDSIDHLVKALGPADLSVVLHALAGSLDGRGDEIGHTIDKLDHLLAVINSLFPLIREDLRLLATNVQTVRAVAPALLDSLENTASIATGLVAHRRQLAALLASAIDLVDDGDHLLDATERQYVRAVLASAGVTDAVYDNRSGVSGQVRALDKLLSRVLTLSEGGPIRVDIRLVDAWKYSYYTAADCPRYAGAAGTNCGRN